MKINFEGIKCDNPYCDFKDEHISMDECKDYLNTPCPQCGSILLTQKDYDLFQELIAAAELLNPLDEDIKDKPILEQSLEMKGDGSLELGEYKIYKNKSFYEEQKKKHKPTIRERFKGGKS